MAEEKGWDKVDDADEHLNPREEGKPYNGTDPISPERAQDLIYQITNSVHELVYGIENVEKDGLGFPVKSEDVMAVYFSAQLQNLLGRGTLRALIKNNFAFELMADMDIPESIGEVDEDGETTHYLPSIAEHYEKYPDHYTKVVKDYYRLGDQS